MKNLNWIEGIKRAYYVVWVIYVTCMFAGGIVTLYDAYTTAKFLTAIPEEPESMWDFVDPRLIVPWILLTIFPPYLVLKVVVWVYQGIQSPKP